ncbi:MAG: YceI family protein [Bacteroidia bacterium]|nr:YceI family protein [Bacteroidia bacterium]
MKHTFFFLPALLLCIGFLRAQIYTGKTTEITFFSSAPLENITAVNKVARPLVNTKTGDVQIKVPVRGFIFEKPLMQEHFNENYMETDKFPDATFKGKLEENIDWAKDGTYKVSIKGTLTVHGVEKERTLPAVVTIKDGIIQVECKFDIVLKDHSITVPELVFQKIAEKVEVTIKSTLQEYHKKQ